MNGPFQDARTDIMGTVESMRKFLGLPASQDLHRECFGRYAPEIDSARYARKKRKFKRDPFAAEDLHKDFSAAIRKVNAMLVARGFERLPTAKYRFYKKD